MELADGQPRFAAANSTCNATEVCEQSIQILLQDVQEVDASGAKVRSASAFNQNQSGVWLSGAASLGAPPADARVATYRMPLAALPACPGGLPPAISPDAGPGSVSLEVLLLGGDTNFTLGAAPPLELLAGNVHFSAAIKAWCENLHACMLQHDSGGAHAASGG